MRKNVLLRTNLAVCCIIILGFIATSVISYRSNQDILRKDVESVTALTAEGIYQQIDSTFSQPIHISQAMANDSLLRDFLAQEEAHQDDAAFIDTMREYLNGYQEKYGYDSVFLASAKTARYYHFRGLDRDLPPDNPENVWFYQFLESDVEYSLNIDNDEVKEADNGITVFINCRIEGPDGDTIGIVGVGFRVDYLQEMFRTYEEKYDVKVSLIDNGGCIQVSTDRTGYEQANLFDTCEYPQYREQILSGQDGMKSFWNTDSKHSGYLAVQYIPILDWRLVVENDTAALTRQIHMLFLREVLLITLIILVVLAVITSVIRSYNKRIIELTVSREQEHQSVFRKATEELYENIYEIDITHNRAASEATEHYFESLGASPSMPFNETLKIIAEKQIKEEFRQGYLDMFSPESVMKAFEEGSENLHYDFMISTDGEKYYWMQITAHIFYWDEDNSVRMLVYRQNIDEEKKRELYLFDRMQRDSLTSLLNKAATQEKIQEMLAERTGDLYAFFILDVDCFKRVNDWLGHAMGDDVLVEFAQTIRSQFRDTDVTGRIGGDEFAVFLKVPDVRTAEKKAQELVNVLHRRVNSAGKSLDITASVGVAVAPFAGSDFETLYRNADAALYQTKANGKNGYTVYCGVEKGKRE